MDVAEVVVETDGHDSYVDGENCAAATPDLLANVEAGLLEHMVSEHADEVATLTSLIRSISAGWRTGVWCGGSLWPGPAGDSANGMARVDCSSMRLFAVRGSAAATDARPARPLPADG